jgi:hypothetical protein
VLLRGKIGGSTYSTKEITTHLMAIFISLRILWMIHS